MTAVEPLTTAPNARVFGVTVPDVNAVEPLPLATRDSTGALVALLVSVMTPDTAPYTCGVNVTVMTWLVFGARTSGNCGLTIVNPLPVTVAAETVVLPFPVLERVILTVAVDPTPTLPKYAVVGLMISVPLEVAVLDPVPDTVRVVVELLAFEVNETLPVTVPLTCGENVIVIGNDDSAGIVIGN